MTPHNPNHISPDLFARIMQETSGTGNQRKIDQRSKHFCTLFRDLFGHPTLIHSSFLIAHCSLLTTLEKAIFHNLNETYILYSSPLCELSVCAG